MKRLAFRFGLGIFLAILVAFGLTAIIVLESFDRQMAVNGPPMAAYCLEQLQAEAGQRADDPAWLAELEVASEMPVIVASPGELGLEPDRLALVQQGGSGMLWIDPGFAAYTSLADGRVLMMGPADLPMTPTRWDLAQILLVLVTVVGSMAFLMALPVVRRLQRLERAAQALGTGDLAARAPEPRGDDAIAQLTRRFNAMAGQVQDLLEGQQRLVQAVAHEIRTPIARLRFGAEMLEMSKDPEERERRRGELEGDLEELEAMVQELLLYSRYESGQAPLDPQPVPIRAVLERLVARLPEGSPTVTISPEEGAPDDVLADARAFERALRNLLANAARHAEGRVRVSWRAEGEAVLIAVEDDGPGVPADQRERVFEPFARLDESRDRRSGGVGLGLAIVRRILRVHGGSVVVDGGALGGARFVTRWPAMV
jgi:two-component system sensor histidine kinase RstB